MKFYKEQTHINIFRIYWGIKSYHCIRYTRNNNVVFYYYNQLHSLKYASKKNKWLTFLLYT